jgi:hypothetical protein
MDLMPTRHLSPKRLVAVISIIALPSDFPCCCGRAANMPLRFRGTAQLRNRALKPSCSKCRSLVSASLRPLWRIVCIEMQSVRL